MIILQADLQTDSIGRRAVTRLLIFRTHFAENIIENIYRDTVLYIAG